MPKQKKKLATQKKSTESEFLDDGLEEKEVPVKPATDEDDLDEELLDLDEAADDDTDKDDEEVGY